MDAGNLGEVKEVTPNAVPKLKSMDSQMTMEYDKGSQSDIETPRRALLQTPQSANGSSSVTPGRVTSAKPFRAVPKKKGLKRKPAVKRSIKKQKKGSKASQPKGPKPAAEQAPLKEGEGRKEPEVTGPPKESEVGPPKEGEVRKEPEATGPPKESAVGPPKEVEVRKEPEATGPPKESEVGPPKEGEVRKEPEATGPPKESEVEKEPKATGEALVTAGQAPPSQHASQVAAPSAPPAAAAGTHGAGAVPAVKLERSDSTDVMGVLQRATTTDLIADQDLHKINRRQDHVSEQLIGLATAAATKATKKRDKETHARRMRFYRSLDSGASKIHVWSNYLFLPNWDGTY